MPSKDDYINYLIEKYGNDGYSYVHSGNCSSFTSYCERYFTSQKVDGREFSVSYSKINNIGFTDQYWLVKNEPAIDEYFRAKFDIFMPYNYDLTYSGEITDMDESKVTADQLLNSKDFKVEIIIHVNYYNIPDINNIDISSFRHEFLKNVRSTSTPTVSYARLKINMEGSGRTENCPNSMATEHTGDGTEVGACSISL